MGLIRTILFFLLGFIVMPILFAIIVVISLMFLLNNVGINDMFSVNIMIWILRGLLLIILFKVQKTIAASTGHKIPAAALHTH